MSQNPAKTPVSTNPKDAFGRLKPSLSLIPPTALIHEARAMMNGAEKYGKYNWRDKTVDCQVYIDALKRHIACWEDGEENAEDSGIHHLGHARACLGILLDAQEQGTMVDTRSKSGKVSGLLKKFTQPLGGVDRNAPMQTTHHVGVDESKTGDDRPDEWHDFFLRIPRRSGYIRHEAPVQALNLPSADRSRASNEQINEWARDLQRAMRKLLSEMVFVSPRRAAAESSGEPVIYWYDMDWGRAAWMKRDGKMYMRRRSAKDNEWLIAPDTWTEAMLDGLDYLIRSSFDGDPRPKPVATNKGPWPIGAKWVHKTGFAYGAAYAEWNGTRAVLRTAQGVAIAFPSWTAELVRVYLRDGLWVPQRRVYIAGPMRGLPLFNFPAFDAARDLAKSKGFDAISPADIDRQSGVNETTETNSVNTPEMARAFVERDVKALLSLRAENNDAIALLPGWEKSTGALAEVFVARWLGLKVLDARTMEPFALGDRLCKSRRGLDEISEAALTYIHSAQ